MPSTCLAVPACTCLPARQACFDCSSRQACPLHLAAAHSAALWRRTSHALPAALSLKLPHHQLDRPDHSQVSVPASASCTLCLAAVKIHVLPLLTSVRRSAARNHYVPAPSRHPATLPCQASLALSLPCAHLAGGGMKCRRQRASAESTWPAPPSQAESTRLTHLVLACRQLRTGPRRTWLHSWRGRCALRVPARGKLGPGQATALG